MLSALMVAPSSKVGRPRKHTTSWVNKAPSATIPLQATSINELPLLEKLDWGTPHQVVFGTTGQPRSKNDKSIQIRTGSRVSMQCAPSLSFLLVEHTRSELMSNCRMTFSRVCDFLVLRKVCLYSCFVEIFDTSGTLKRLNLVTRCLCI
jgi:hypothetical protein